MGIDSYIKNKTIEVPAIIENRVVNKTKATLGTVSSLIVISEEGAIEKGAPEANDVCGPQGSERGSKNCFVQVFNVTKGNVSVCICNDLANHNQSPTSHRKSNIILYMI